MARSAWPGIYTLPSLRRWRRSSGGKSTKTTSLASSNIWSGTVSRTRIPVTPPTTSFRLSKCCTLTVVSTSMPASNSSSTSCQRLGWREPLALLCASSSMRISAGRRASAASKSNSRIWRLRWWMRFRGRAVSPSSKAAVSLRPCVSTTPTSTSNP